MTITDYGAMKKVLEFARRSPDPSTQNGSVLGLSTEWLYEETFSVNEFPRYVRYLPDRWERPIKYEYIEHAERNAIYAAARNGIATKNTTLWCPWAACSDCARAIIQSGIIRLVRLEREENVTHQRWDASVDIGMQMLEEAGIEVVYLPKPVLDLTLLRNGKPLKFGKEL